MDIDGKPGHECCIQNKLAGCNYTILAMETSPTGTGFAVVMDSFLSVSAVLTWPLKALGGD